MLQRRHFSALIAGGLLAGQLGWSLALAEPAIITLPHSNDVYEIGPAKGAEQALDASDLWLKEVGGYRLGCFAVQTSEKATLSQPGPNIRFAPTRATAEDASAGTLMASTLINYVTALGGEVAPGAGGWIVGR